MKRISRRLVPGTLVHVVTTNVKWIACWRPVEFAVSLGYLKTNDVVIYLGEVRHGAGHFMLVAHPRFGRAEIGQSLFCDVWKDYLLSRISQGDP